MKEPEGNPDVRDPELEFRDLEDLSEEEAREQVEKLREAIEYHDHRYYVESDPVISDRTYDRLYSRLEELEQEFDLADENSPTQRVGGEPVDELETVEHVSEMLSLDSSEEEEEVRDFADRVQEAAGDVEYSVEPKFDGLSVEFVYRDGELERAVTRGNGQEGDDITENARTIRTVPLHLSRDVDIVVRGEVYMPRDGFQELNEERVRQGKDAFANPRNAAAGTVRQLDPSVVADRPLDVYFYDVMEYGGELGSQREVFELLRELGLKVNDTNRIVDSIDGFVEYRNRMLEKREELNYGIDGVVAKVNDFGKREELGTTASHPRWAFAYKFPARTGETTVEKIVVQVGRTGKLTPVALLDPIDVDGVTISRASLHNEKQCQELGIGEGAKVKVERAGDVIPQVKEVVEEAEQVFEMPSNCPVCGSEVVGEQEHHFCSGGISCEAQLKRQLEHFASEQAMDIEGIGEKVAEQLVDSGLVEKVPDLYRLEKEDLMELEKFGDKSSRKLLEEIENSRNPGLASFITALGIRHVGRETARLLADNFTLDQLREAGDEQLRELDEIGPEVAESIVDFFSGSGDETVDELLDTGVEPHREETGDEFSGLKLVITGSIEGYSREELKELLERQGADVTSSVSGETDYLVVGEDPGSTKLEDAEEHGVEQLNEDKLRREILSRL